MTRDDYILKLTEYKQLLSAFLDASDSEREDELRTEINKKKAFIIKIIKRAGTFKTYTIQLPRSIGGLIYQNLNPFDLIFDPPYGCSVIQPIIDTIDETIGVIEADDNFSLEFQANTITNSVLSKKIFIVHGHDEKMKLDVSNVLRQLEFEPVILNDKANSGKTIIEKIESYSDVGFAVILMSPCDIGYEKGDEKNAKPRARQNVIAELGYFVGLLGRNKTFILKKDDVEEPSDFSGVVYELYDDKGAWKMQMVKELKAAGYSVDANKMV